MMRLSIKDRITARLGVLSVSAGILLAAFGAPATASASEVCPNEAVRAQQGVTTRLPECRGYELATPIRENGQEALVPKDTTGLEIQYQASAEGPSTTWAMTGGPAGSQSAGEFVDGIGTGTTAGTLWSDLSLAPDTRFHPIGTPGPRNGGRFEYYSPNLTCGIEDTPLPQAKNAGEETPELAPGESTSEEIDQLYMWTAPNGVAPTEANRGSYQLVTSTRPRNPGASGPYGGGGYRVAGASEDCGHISFDTGSAGYELETEKGSGKYGPQVSLYEWSAATGPKVASILPDGTPAKTVLSYAAGEKSSDLNSVSADGSKVFFTANSDAAEGVEAPGTSQVYARVNSSSTVHVSATETATADNGARFQAAAADGNRVFFLANYGLTAHTSKGAEAPTECQFTGAVTTAAGQGCDLYQYEFSSGKLTDLSADEGATGDTKGANARGLVGISKDGSYVYFSTGGQLVAGEGNSGATNETNKEANVYAYHAGHVSYVATIKENEAGGGKAGVQSEEALDAVAAPGHGLTFLVARVSPNGQHALIASYGKLTSYDNTDKNTGQPDPELYEYNYTEGPGSVTCVSCNPTGEKPITNEAEAHKPFSPLGPYIEVRGGSNLHRSLLNDGRVFFDSYTPLVAQEPAVTEMVHPYEWRPNGVNGCATAAGCVTLLDSGTEQFPSYFQGASEDGENVYISTPQSLAGEDEDGGMRDILDVRVNGGIFKPAPAKGCSPTEDTCQGQGETFNQQSIGSGSTTGDQPPLTLVTPQPPAPPALSPVKISGHSGGHKSLRLVIVVPAAGSVAVSGAGIVTTHTSATHAGTYRLTVALTAKSKATLRKHRRVKLSVRVTFKPSSGASSSAALTASLK